MKWDFFFLHSWLFQLFSQQDNLSSCLHRGLGAELLTKLAKQVFHAFYFNYWLGHGGKLFQKLGFEINCSSSLPSYHSGSNLKPTTARFAVVHSLIPPPACTAWPSDRFADVPGKRCQNDSWGIVLAVKSDPGSQEKQKSSRKDGRSSGGLGLSKGNPWRETFSKIT